MLLADVVRASNQVSRASSRNAKVSLIADLLRRCALMVADGAAPADEIGLATRYLSGSEIAFDGVQTSPRYPGGLALRFARVVRHRPDKTASEADPIELVEALRPT